MSWRGFVLCRFSTRTTGFREATTDAEEFLLFIFFHKILAQDAASSENASDRTCAVTAAVLVAPRWAHADA